MNNCTRFVRSLLFPPCCVLCGGPGHRGLDLCRACRAELPWLAQACLRCARPLAGAELVCGACLSQPPAFDHAIAAFRYEKPLDTLIQRLKFDHRLHYARLLAALLLERLAGRSEPLPQALLAVPLHPARQRQRGFNQALELARPLARGLGLELLPDACRRVRATETQSLLPRAARRANVRGAFTATGPLAAHVAIVDDVVTTASTVQTMAACLRAAGAQRIEIWCVARADGAPPPARARLRRAADNR